MYATAAAQELAPDGIPSGIYVKFVLVADKPFIRHVCGLLSHNADAFGAPFCECCDEDKTSTIYDYTMDKHTHYGQTTFYDLCHRAHVAPWEALGQDEPKEWRFICPCCNEVRHTQHTCSCTALTCACEALDRSSTRRRAAKRSSRRSTRRSPPAIPRRSGRTYSRRTRPAPRSRQGTARSSAGVNRCCPSITLCLTPCTACTMRRTSCWTRQSTGT